MEQGGRMQELDVVQGVHILEQELDVVQGVHILEREQDGTAQAHGRPAQGGMEVARGAVLGRDVAHDVVQEQDVAQTDLYGNEFNSHIGKKNFVQIIHHIVFESIYTNK